MKPYVITGMGIVSAYGGGNEKFISGTNEGKSGIGPLSVITESSYENTQGGEIQNFDPESVLGKKGLRTMSRIDKIILESIEHLRQKFGFTAELDANKKYSSFNSYKNEDVAIIIGSMGPVHSDSNFGIQVIKDPRSVLPSDFPGVLACVPAGYTAIRNSIKAGAITLQNGETSSLDTFGYAANLLEDQKANMVIVGGVEVLSIQYALIQQKRLKKHTGENAFLGEGGALFSAESSESATGRNAQILAEVLAYKNTYHPEIEQGLARNYDALKKMVGEDNWNNITHVFPSRFSDLDRNILSGLNAEYHEINDRLGYLFSAIGGFKLATALVMNQIPEGSLVLIVDADLNGRVASLLIRKK